TGQDEQHVEQRMEKSAVAKPAEAVRNDGGDRGCRWSGGSGTITRHAEDAKNSLPVVQGQISEDGCGIGLCVNVEDDDCLPISNVGAEQDCQGSWGNGSVERNGRAMVHASGRNGGANFDDGKDGKDIGGANAAQGRADVLSYRADDLPGREKMSLISASSGNEVDGGSSEGRGCLLEVTQGSDLGTQCRTNARRQLKEREDEVVEIRVDPCSHRRANSLQQEMRTVCLPAGNDFFLHENYTDAHGPIISCSRLGSFASVMSADTICEELTTYVGGGF
ncbi:hypothetical protein CBR_g78174, partial [Chara braunii]